MLVRMVLALSLSVSRSALCYVSLSFGHLV